jgi:hypothetical protein
MKCVARRTYDAAILDEVIGLLDPPPALLSPARLAVLHVLMDCPNFGLLKCLQMNVSNTFSGFATTSNCKSIYQHTRIV